MRHSGAIGRVAVDGAAAGRGIGSHLMAAAVDLADNWLNLYRLELLVRADNQVAIRLYEKFGFISVATRQSWRGSMPAPPGCAARKRYSARNRNRESPRRYARRKCPWLLRPT